MAFFYAAWRKPEEGAGDKGGPLEVIPFLDGAGPNDYKEHNNHLATDKNIRLDITHSTREERLKVT